MKEIKKKDGTFFSYSESPRSNIFRREHKNVVDIDSMIRLMRFLLVFKQNSLRII